MPKDEGPGAQLALRTDLDGVESQTLLGELSGEQRENNGSPGTPTAELPPRRITLPRQSSISLPSPDGQRRPPRTTNRVRFDLDDDHDGDNDDDGEDGNNTVVNGHTVDPSRDSEDSWLEDEDYESTDGRDVSSGTGDGGQRLPLLTNLEAPSVTLATSAAPEQYLEEARPRSGIRMSFMNMANSIIGAGIIGQPYALRQAGVLVGTILLIVLTITVDWTIRLIVVNSKLSGADSYQATMQHCFGKAGLIAISIAQWVFAFGGMVAFCIIVGDTIPRVLGALIPSLRNAHFLWLLTDRRAMITFFTLTVSYPLSLYRDIAKVRAFPPPPGHIFINVH